METTVVHDPTKEVLLRRKEIKNSHLPVLVRNEAVNVLGSALGEGGSPLRGLTTEEEAKYLPSILGTNKNDPQYQKKINEFWADMRIKVGPGGVPLKVGLDSNGEPINLMDWIKYRWILKHPLVADSELGLRRNESKKFFVFDPQVESNRQNAKVNIRKKAYVEFAKISGENRNQMKLTRLVRLLTDSNADAYSAIDLENILDGIIATNPDKFLALCLDKDMDIKSAVHNLVERSVLNKVGSTYLYLDQVIGHSLEEVVLFIKKTENAPLVSEMKAKLDEATKA